MIIQCVCKDCNSEVGIYGFVTQDDLVGTPYEHMIANHFDGHTFDEWFKKMLDAHLLVRDKEDMCADRYFYGGTYDEETDTMINPQGCIEDADTKWERAGNPCPVCASKNTRWF